MNTFINSSHLIYFVKLIFRDIGGNRMIGRDFTADVFGNLGNIIDL